MNKRWISTILSVTLLSMILGQPISAAENQAFFTLKNDTDVSVKAPSETESDSDERLIDELVNRENTSVFQLSQEVQNQSEWRKEAQAALAAIAEEREIMALIYLSDEYPVRVSPSYDSEVVVTVLSGQQVNIQNWEMDEEGENWEYVRLEFNGRQYFGYVPRAYLACSDSRFLKWEEQYGTNPGKPMTYSAISGEKTYPDIEQFPESYQPALLALKEKHPNWTFVVMKTTLDWETVIYNEMQGGRSLVHKSMQEWTKDGLYDTGNWYYATEEALKLYMDPRNHLTEDAVFQFEQLTYNEEYHTLEAVESFLNNTFMRSRNSDGSINCAPKTDLTYSTIFWAIGREDIRRVSPFHLVARVLQEQGSGTSPLISGTYEGYEGYYNYFNVGASGTKNKEVIENGLKYAKEHGWNSAYFSIQGGADFISANYIRKGQDTLYLEKYNVNPNGTYKPYTHQYMQNISAPTTEAQSIKKLYQNAKALDSPFVFKIPVYENMPHEVCGIPEKTTDVSLTLPAGYTDTTVWLDGVAYEGEMRDRKLVVHAPDANARTAVVYQYNDNGVPVNMYVWSLRYNGLFYKVTAEPGLENLLSYHGFSIRITGKSGIRFKTGISAALRTSLTSSGVNGYTLKEYGTLVMNNANREQYAMIKGGTKVASGMAYGTDENGNRQDVIFETVGDRYRYTSVLVGMPPEQYKTEYAFRGYAVLEKDGQQVVIYGPAMAKSIYALANQLLEQGSYAEGSSAYEFLKQLISDADNTEQKE